MASQKAIAVLSKQLEYLLGEPIEGKALETWWQVLSPIQDDLLKNATMRFLQKETHRYSVMPGAIYQAALEILREQHPSPGEAWAMINEAIGDAASKEGLYTDDRFTEIHKLPEVVRKAAEQTGIMAMIHSRNLTADRARFLEFYQVVVNRQVKEMLALPEAEQKALKEVESEVEPQADLPGVSKGG